MYDHNQYYSMDRLKKIRESSVPKHSSPVPLTSFPNCSLEVIALVSVRVRRLEEWSQQNYLQQGI